MSYLCNTINVPKVYAIMTKKQGDYTVSFIYSLSFVVYGITAYILGGIEGQFGDSQKYIIEKKEGEFLEYQEKNKQNTGLIVASKTGKKYYFSWCSGVSRIKEENRRYFETEKEAEGEGLTLSKTCD